MDEQVILTTTECSEGVSEPSKPPASIARRRPNGGWYVETTWQNGRREQIGQYSTAAEAEAYIRQQLEAWHDGQRKFAASL